ncbi:hypothetical protein EK904_010857, partial [Melospiza melodia maxima]
WVCSIAATAASLRERSVSLNCSTQSSGRWGTKATAEFGFSVYPRTHLRNQNQSYEPYVSGSHDKLGELDPLKTTLLQKMEMTNDSKKPSSYTIIKSVPVFQRSILISEYWQEKKNFSAKTFSSLAKTPNILTHKSAVSAQGQSPPSHRLLELRHRVRGSQVPWAAMPRAGPGPGEAPPAEAPASAHLVQAPAALQMSARHSCCQSQMQDISLGLGHPQRGLRSVSAPWTGQDRDLEKVSMQEGRKEDTCWGAVSCSSSVLFLEKPLILTISKETAKKVPAHLWRLQPVTNVGTPGHELGVVGCNHGLPDKIDDQKLEKYLSLEGDTNFGVWEIDLLVFRNLEIQFRRNKLAHRNLYVILKRGMKCFFMVLGQCWSILKRNLSTFILECEHCRIPRPSISIFRSPKSDSPPPLIGHLDSIIGNWYQWGVQKNSGFKVYFHEKGLFTEEVYGTRCGTLQHQEHPGVPTASSSGLHTREDRDRKFDDLEGHSKGRSYTDYNAQIESPGSRSSTEAEKDEWECQHNQEHSLPGSGKEVELPPVKPSKSCSEAALPDPLTALSFGPRDDNGAARVAVPCLLTCLCTLHTTPLLTCPLLVLTTPLLTCPLLVLPMDISIACKWPCDRPFP